MVIYPDHRISNARELADQEVALAVEHYEWVFQTRKPWCEHCVKLFQRVSDRKDEAIDFRNWARSVGG